MARVWNFSAGPSTLPEQVLQTAATEMMDYQGSGQSVMEMSHRSKTFDKIIKDALVMLLAEAACRAVRDRRVADENKLSLYALFVERALHLFERDARAAVCARAAVDQKNLHGMTLLYSL